MAKKLDILLGNDCFYLAQEREIRRSINYGFYLRDDVHLDFYYCVKKSDNWSIHYFGEINQYFEITDVDKENVYKKVIYALIVAKRKKIKNKDLKKEVESLFSLERMMQRAGYPIISQCQELYSLWLRVKDAS